MDKKFSKFQIITLALFVFFLIAGVISFAFYKGGSSGTSLPTITIWGTFPKDTFDQYVSKISNTSGMQITINYVQESQSQFSLDFVSALARGHGPDVILVPTDLLLQLENKLALIPYTSISQRTFMDTYIQEANIYLNSNGVIGFPFMVDPLVMYWNRDMFDAAGVATYPKYWDDFINLNKSLTIKDQNGNIRKSAIALGQFGNVANAREIFGAILMQTGNPVTIQAADGSVSSSVKTDASVNPELAIRFFSQFVDPASQDYSWNKTMSNSKAAFLSGTLATYFGFASELSDLRAKNPNINFDVALLPGPKSGGTNTTYGRLYGFSLVHSSPNVGAAYQIVSLLTSPQYLGTLSNGLYLPSVRRDVISAGSKDPYITLFNRAALISSTWLDADPSQSSQIFSDMIQSFTSGQSTVYQAIKDAGGKYDVLLQKAQYQ